LDTSPTYTWAISQLFHCLRTETISVAATGLLGFVFDFMHIAPYVAGTSAM
jgi:hypothetical protein